MHAKANGVGAFGGELAAKLGINLIGIVPRSPCWYPQAEIEIIADLLRGKVRGPAIAYGASMGGYGALRWGKALGATHALACSPQATIDPAVTGVADKRYSRYFDTELHRNMAIKPGDAPDGSVFVHDPTCAPDRFHADILSTLPGMTGIIAPHIGHQSGFCVSGTQHWLSVMKDLMAGDLFSLRRRVLAKRKESAQYDLGLAEHAGRCRRIDFARVVAERARTRDPVGYHMVMAMIERRAGYPKAAEQHYEAVLELRPGYPTVDIHLAKVRRSLAAKA